MLPAETIPDGRSGVARGKAEPSVTELLISSSDESPMPRSREDGFSGLIFDL
jgi:hypothetical protein